MLCEHRRPSRDSDLAVIATPPGTLPSLIAELGNKGTRAAIIVTAGLDRDLKQKMLDAARPTCLRIIGPNCLGVWVPALGVNANFGMARPAPGKLAFLSQSGALVGGVLDWATSHGIGFSYVVSMGEMADVDVGDLLDFLAADISTGAILLYLETIPSARKFMSASRSAARAKPVVVIKSGRSAASAKAAATHTGALAGSDAAVAAAFRRAGLVRVEDLEDLFTAAETLTCLKPVAGNEILIVTNGGGAGVLAVDDLVQTGGALAKLGPDLLAKLDTILPKTWSRANPIDIIGDATPERYAATMEAVLEDPHANAILVMNCPTALASSTGAAEAVIGAVDRHRASGNVPAILTNWLGAAVADEARVKFQEASIPSYESPREAIKGFGFLWQYARAQEALMRTPPREADLSEINTEAARAAMAPAAKEGRALLTEPEAKAVLRAYGIPTVPTRVAATPQEVEVTAGELLEHAPALAVKVLSEDISHKSDVGGVRLGLQSADDARAAAEDIMRRVAKSRPDARLEGFTVQPMIVRPTRRAAARRFGGSPVRPGHPVRRRRRRDRGGEGQCRGAAAARRRACPRPDAPDAHLQSPQRLSRPAGGRSRSDRRRAGALVAARGGYSGGARARRQSAACRRERDRRTRRPHRHRPCADRHAWS